LNRVRVGSVRLREARSQRAIRGGRTQRSTNWGKNSFRMLLPAIYRDKPQRKTLKREEGSNVLGGRPYKRKGRSRRKEKGGGEEGVKNRLS